MNINQCQLVDHCLISGEPVVKILDFGQHAYADSFISESQLNLSEPVFPLQVCMNSNSGMIQLGYVSSDKERYNLYSYSYTSSNSKTARDHWDEFAKSVKEKVDIKKFVVEIGSNDGYLISQFQDEGVRTIGIDPSMEMCMIARERGVEVMPAMFCETVAKDLAKRIGPADLVIANNVFNHANDPLSFARAVNELLSDSGMFVFEVPYWKSMIDSQRFTDMVYHEHPCYFTIKGTHNLLAKAGLEIVKYQIVNYHGGSLRVYARKQAVVKMPIQVANAIAEETAMGLFNEEFYQTLQRQFEIQRSEWLSKFNQIYLSDPDAVFIGVGAAAKANTWLTWHGLNHTHLHCITDASAFKQGKYTPLTRIPIRGDEEFALHANPYAVVLSWNIGEGLKSSILNINPNTRFISQ